MKPHQSVLQVGVSVVVTLCILCGPCNYYWGRYHALLSAPRGTIRAEWVSHFASTQSESLLGNYSTSTLSH